MFENIGPAEGASGCMQSGSSGRNRGRAAVEADAIGEQLIRQCKRRAHAAAEGDAIGGQVDTIGELHRELSGAGLLMVGERGGSS